MTGNATQNQRTIAAVIVNYRTAELVLRNLAGLAAQCAAAGKAEIVIVENCSPTDDTAILRQALAEGAFACPVRLIESPVNGGFGAGNNVALRALFGAHTAPEFVLMINPDASLRAGALAAMITVMDANPRCAFAGPKIFRSDGVLSASAFRRFSVASEFEQTARAAPVSALLRRFRVPLEKLEANQPVDWVSGAVFLARTTALQEIGLFDESFFLYFEEADLMLRGQVLGWETWHVVGAEAEHLEGQSDPQNATIDRVLHPSDHWYRSREHYFRKTHGPAYAALADAARAAGSIVDIVRTKVSGRATEEVRSELLRFLRKEFLTRRQ